MERGADQEAEALLQSLAAMFPERQTPREPNTQQGTRDPAATKEPPTTPKQPTTAPPEVPEEGQIKEEGGVFFIVGAIPDHTYCGFINALRDVYTFKTFSDWFWVHKDCCDNIMRREGFCSGLRYKLAVRANAFQCDMVCSKTLCFPDVLLPCPEIQFETSAEAKQNNKSSYIDYPYLPGGKKENFNTYTGVEKTNTQNKNNNNNRTNKNKPRGTGQQNNKQGQNQWEPYSTNQENNN
jgi:hypothetical protein